MLWDDRLCALLWRIQSLCETQHVLLTAFTILFGKGDSFPCWSRLGKLPMDLRNCYHGCRSADGLLLNIWVGYRYYRYCVTLPDVPQRTPKRSEYCK